MDPLECTIWPKGGDQPGLIALRLRLSAFPWGPKGPSGANSFPGDPWTLDPENKPLHSSRYIVYLISELTPENWGIIPPPSALGPRTSVYMKIHKKVLMFAKQSINQFVLQ